jgi:hypothetical protein
MFERPAKGNDLCRSPAAVAVTVRANLKRINRLALVYGTKRVLTGVESPIAAFGLDR